MKKTVLLFTAAVALCFGACKDGDDSASMAEQHNEQALDNTGIERDGEFAVKAAAASLMEIELGNLAQTNGSAASVKQFGQTMVSDHSAANDELRNAAQAKNIALPATPTDDQLKTIENMRQKTGAEFDKDYINLMVKEHKDAIDLFEKEAEKGNDPDLKTWASGKLATLHHHQEMAEGIDEELKNSK